MAIARVTEAQHGVVALAQLQALGLGKNGASKRAANGRLHRIHRGVYSIAPLTLLTARGHWMAAVLACRPKAVLSHRSAAALWGLRPDDRRTTDISLPSKSVRQRPRITVHAANSLHPKDATTADGIPCTTLARTLFDLADTRPRREAELAVNQAEILRLFDGRAVDAVIARMYGTRGASTLSSVLDDYNTPTVTRSELEELFFTICDEAGVERPEVGAWIPLEGGGVEPDFLWRAPRLVVETDGRAVHGTRAAFESDRRRDQRLMVAGYRVVRFTWRQIVCEPDEVARTIAALLG